jgi:hypothetical protein
MRGGRRRPPITLRVPGFSRWLRMLLGRWRVGRCRRSSAEVPKVGPRCPATGRRGRRRLRSRPSDSRSAWIVRGEPPKSGRERTGPGAPPMGSRVTAPIHQLLTSGRGTTALTTGLRPRPVGTLPMSVRVRSGQRRLPSVNRGPSGRRRRCRRVGSGPIRRARRQGSGRRGRGPSRRRSPRRRPPRRPIYGHLARRARPYPLALRDLSIVLSRRRGFRRKRGVVGRCRGAGPAAVRLGLPTHRGTDPHRVTTLTTHAPGSRPLGRRKTMAERLHHQPVQVPTRGPAEPPTRNPVERR